MKKQETCRTRPLLTLAAGVAAMALLLAGCGGGGTVKKDPKPKMVDLSGLAADVMTEAGTLDLKADASGDLGEVTFTCAAGGDDCSVTVTVRGETTSATSTGGMVTAKASAGYAGRKAGEQKALTREAGTKWKAIQEEALQVPDAGLGGTARTDADGTNTSGNTADDVYRMAIERDRTGTTITITDPHMNADDDRKFMQAQDMGDGLTRHTRTMDADDDGNVAMETVVVKTDIEAPVAVPFESFRAADGTQTQQLNRDLDNDTETSEGLNIHGDNAQSVMSAAFAPTAAFLTTLTFSGDDSSTGDTDEATAVKGTFNGAAGMYRCTVDDGNCTITLNDKGTITGVGNIGDWVFIPDEGATSDQPDYDYLHYGFWLKQTTKDGEVTYDEVETFAGTSVNASDGNNIDTVLGSATYQGGAVGVYVKNMYGTDGTIASATAGHFTADASLTANFSGTSVAADKHNTVSGTIDNFVLSGGEENSWSVSLESAGRAANGNTVVGDTDGGGSCGDNDCKYSATFHGPTDPYDHDDNDQTPDINRVPHTLIGEFNANFVNGTVAGAFGARKQ